jgi:hypothetical protein
MNREDELMAAVEDPSVLDGPSYPDDVVAVMRDTITALREQVAELRRSNDALRAHAKALLDQLAELTSAGAT